MNRAEKILKEKYLNQLGVSHNQYIAKDFDESIKAGAYDYALDAMREIAWEAWKKSVNLMWGMFTPKGEEMAKEEFNEWYNEKEK